MGGSVALCVFSVVSVSKTDQPHPLQRAPAHILDTNPLSTYPKTAVIRGTTSTTKATTLSTVKTTKLNPLNARAKADG